MLNLLYSTLFPLPLLQSKQTISLVLMILHFNAINIFTSWNLPQLWNIWGQEIRNRDYRTRYTTHETFLAFLIALVDGRQATQMTVRPNEEEQIQMIIKNLLPSYHRFTITYFSHYWPNFKKIIALAMQEEDSVNSGMLKNEETPKSKRLQTIWWFQ